jgi:hypothetical protein
MGYYADFEFDLVIPAEHVEAAEKAMIESLVEGKQLNVGECSNICEAFNSCWEHIAYEKEPVPLMALVSGTARGAVHIEGHAGKKWRDWEEPMLDAIAPFVKKGSTVTVKGEDFDAPSEWVFDGEVRYQEDYENIRCEERAELLAKAARLEKAEALLRRLHDWNHVAMGGFESKVWDDLDSFLPSEASPLEQLAKAAE